MDAEAEVSVVAAVIAVGACAVVEEEVSPSRNVSVPVVHAAGRFRTEQRAECETGFGGRGGGGGGRGRGGPPRGGRGGARGGGRGGAKGAQGGRKVIVVSAQMFYSVEALLDTDKFAGTPPSQGRFHRSWWKRGPARHDQLRSRTYLPAFRVLRRVSTISQAWRHPS